MTPLARALLLGTATGLRTFMGAAWWSGARPKERSSTLPAPLVERWLAADGVALAMRLAAATELIGDKLPFAGDRIAPGPLAARAAMGGLLGWAAGSDGRDYRAALGLAGAAAAVAAAYGGYWARRLITEAGAPDPAVAVAEDAIAVALAATGSGRR